MNQDDRGLARRPVVTLGHRHCQVFMWDNVKFRRRRSLRLHRTKRFDDRRMIGTGVCKHMLDAAPSQRFDKGLRN